MAFTTLVDAATLSAALDNPDWAIVDCRFALDDGGWGEQAYQEAHIPGAVYAHLDRDMSGTKTGTNGRHPLPDPALLAERLGQFGIADGVQVIAYDQDAGSYASRLWWLIRWVGHDAVAVLDGGFAAWQLEGHPTRSGRESRPIRRLHARVRQDMVVDTATVSATHGRDDWRLIDARAPERFRGDFEPIDRVPGHIPGAVNRFFKSNLDASGSFRSVDELRQQWQSTLAGVSPDRVVCYCGSGVTACHNLLALEHAGYLGAKLYVGSWSEWSSEPSRPVAGGE
jgi:thiosulfate/3-mercaptopyruvate sulfurtransferase